MCVWDSAVVLRIQTLGKHTQSVTYKQIINQLWWDARSVIYLWGTCLESNVIQHHGYAANPVFVLGQPICGEPGSEVSLHLQQQVGFWTFHREVLSSLSLNCCTNWWQKRNKSNKIWFILLNFSHFLLTPWYNFGNSLDLILKRHFMHTNRLKHSLNAKV